MFPKMRTLITLKNIWLLISRDPYSFINTTSITLLLSIDCSKSNVTKNIFNLQEWHQNMQNCKSYSSKSLFIKHLQCEQKLKTCREQPDLVCGCFVKVFYKMTTCPRWSLLRGPNSGCLLQVWLYFQCLPKWG